MKRFTKRKIIFGTAALLAFCCVGLAVISLFSPDDPEGKGEATAVAEVGEVAAEETATSETEPTVTARPTETAVPPTDTPPPPTSTAAPTATAVATDTPDPNRLTAEEQLYVDSVVEISGNYSEALAFFSEQMGAASEDTALMFDEDWRIRVALSTVMMTLAGEAVRELEPSERFKTLNDYLLEAAEHYDLVAELVPVAIDELDVEKLNRANEEILLGQLAIEAANEEMLRMLDEGLLVPEP